MSRISGSWTGSAATHRDSSNGTPSGGNMSNTTDPLAPYRKKPATGPQTSPPSIKDEYSAFDAKDRVERLKIRQANGPTRAPGYVHLMDVAYDGSFGTNFVLSY